MPRIAQGVVEAGFSLLHADPGTNPADRPAGARCGRTGPDRHRQDRGLPGGTVPDTADPAGAADGRHLGPCAGDCADARAGGADPQGRRAARASTPDCGLAWCTAAPTTTSSAARWPTGWTCWSALRGGIIDYFKQQVFDLRHVQVLVLDEADRMFDLGFIADIRYLMRRLPRPEPAAVDAVLGHALAAGAGAGLRAHEQSRAGTHRAGQGDDRSHPAGHLLSLHGGEGAAADRAAALRPKRIAPWYSSIPGAWPSGSKLRCAPTASMPRRCRATCRSRSGCASCASSTRANWRY